MKLNDLIEEALSKNPDVLAAKSKWEVLRERPPQAGSLDDPMVGLGIVNLPTDTFNFRNEDMTMKEISVTQQVPYPGKRGLRSEMAQKEAEAAYNEYEETKNKVSRDVKMAYLRTLLCEQSHRGHGKKPGDPETFEPDCRDQILGGGGDSHRCFQGPG